jgi:hypothetical protein
MPQTTYRVLISTDLGGDPDDIQDAPAEVCQATINHWRVDYLRDWKARWRRYG